MKTITAKFGGSSLADAAQFRKVAAIVHEDPARRFVVASAPGKRSGDDVKVTDLLYACYDQAVAGQDFSRMLSRVEKRFRSIADELGVEADVSRDIEVIRRHLSSSPSRDYMASRGEYLNSRLLALYLGFPFVDPAQCVHFDNGGVLDDRATYEALKAKLGPLSCAVVAGFYGTMPDGSVRTFSRGGSDITGALVAEATGSDLYENWTDVSGMMAADPRIVDYPRPVELITYRELRILSYMGASVLHTDAVLPARRRHIPINIRNTNLPYSPGTLIVPRLPDTRIDRPVTGVAGRTGLSTVQVEKSMVSDGAGFTAILLDVFKAHRVPFEQCLTGIDTVSVVIRSDLFLPYKEDILRDIREKLDPDTLRVEEHLAMIAVVGESVPDARGITVHILDTVARAGIEVNTINQGSGDLNLIVGVTEEDYEAAVRAIYSAIC